MKLGRYAALAAAVVLALPAAAVARTGHAGAAPAPQRLQLVLPLVTRQAALARFAAAVSTPGSPAYGHYRSVAWLARHFGAGAVTRRRVLSYLRSHGASAVRIDATGQLAYARIGVAAAQRLFGTALRARDGGRRASVLEPAGRAVLPRALRGLVTGVVGLGSARVAGEVPPPSSGYQGPDPGATPSGCPAGIEPGGFTPNEYLDAYHYTELHQRGLLGQGERVALVEIDGFRERDLQRFARCFHLHVPRIDAFGVDVPRRLPPGGEATLDLEVLEAAAPDLRAVDVYETSPDAADVLKAISRPLQNPTFKPQVISVSLGLCENSTLQGVGRVAIRAIETSLQVAAADGISVLGASGDFGSADCALTDSAPPAPVPALAVNFPSSSPWVTSVGGTNLSLDAQNQIVSQTVWNDGSTLPGNASGGGFSRLFRRPSWQDGVVSGDWRAQPDVAMLADVSPGYAVYCTASQDCHGRGWQTFGGTSAATPLVAGGFALIDQLLRRHGRVALGLADPLLYRLGRNPTTAAEVYFDVTSGSNDVGPFIRSSQQPLGCCTAQPGYDEASGWGGVNVDALARQAVAMQHALADASLTLPPDQRPYARGGIYANLACTGACDAVAYARLSAPGMPTFTAYSPLLHLTHRGHRRVKVGFNPRQLTFLRTVLRAHRRITAEVLGAVVEAGGNVERRTPPLTLHIQR